MEVILLSGRREARPARRGRRRRARLRAQLPAPAAARRGGDAGEGRRAAQREELRARHEAKTVEQAQAIADTLAQDRAALRGARPARPGRCSARSRRRTSPTRSGGRARSASTGARSGIDPIKRIGRYDVPDRGLRGRRRRGEDARRPRGRRAAARGGARGDGGGRARRGGGGRGATEAEGRRAAARPSSRRRTRRRRRGAGRPRRDRGRGRRRGPPRTPASRADADDERPPDDFQAEPDPSRRRAADFASEQRRSFHRSVHGLGNFDESSRSERGKRPTSSVRPAREHVFRNACRDPHAGPEAQGAVHSLAGTRRARVD